MINRFIKNNVGIFFFSPCKTNYLAVLRMGLGILLLCQAYFLRYSSVTLFSHNTYMRNAPTNPISSFLPTISNFYQLIPSNTISENHFINLFIILYILSLIALTLGFKVRLSAFIAWFFHLGLLATSPYIIYGFDLLSHILLFYLIWMPSNFEDYNPLAKLSLRYLQFHLCIIYLSSGIEKLKNPLWINGEQLWRALTIPRFNLFDLSWPALIPGLLMGLSLLIIFLETGYAFFIWHKSFRKYFLAGTIVMHIGIMFFMGMPLFGLLMILLNTCLFIIGSHEKHS